MAVRTPNWLGNMQKHLWRKVTEVPSSPSRYRVKVVLVKGRAHFAWRDVK